MKNITSTTKLVQAIGSVNSSAGASVQALKIDGTGYSRARFIFNFGIPLAGASCSAQIFGASAGDSSSGTWSSYSTALLTLMTSGNSSCLTAIDMAISSALPWLIVSGYCVTNSNWPLGVTCELYQGMNRIASPSTSATPNPVQTIVV